jgi:hypothetical protein
MLTFQNTTQTKYARSLDKLRILTFWDIIKTKNLFLLDFDYEEAKKYSKKQSEEISSIWSNLYDEYYLLIDDSMSRAKMSKTFDELNLRNKINQVKNNYDFLIQLIEFRGSLLDKDFDKYEQETYKRLIVIDKRIKPLYFDGIEANLNNLDKVLKALINKYNQEHKDNNKQVEKEISNVYDVVASAESWLERNLDINTMVVSHWVALQKQIKDKQKAQQKNVK